MNTAAYILIIIWTLSGNNNYGVTMQEFGNLKACSLALEKLIPMVKSDRLYSIECVPKFL